MLGDHRISASPGAGPRLLVPALLPGNRRSLFCQDFIFFECPAPIVGLVRIVGPASLVWWLVEIFIYQGDILQRIAEPNIWYIPSPRFYTWRYSPLPLETAGSTKVNRITRQDFLFPPRGRASNGLAGILLLQTRHESLRIEIFNFIKW